MRDAMGKRTVAILFLIGFAIVGLASATALEPRWVPWAPFPFLSFAILARLESWPVVWSYGPVLFAVWSWHLAVGRVSLPRRSVVLFLVLAVLSIVHYVRSWPYGLKYHGAYSTYFVGEVNFGSLTVLALLAIWGRRQPRYFVNYSFHVLLFIWFVSYWAPYLGELP